MTQPEVTVEGFSPGGKGHSMLRAIEREPQTLEALFDLVRATTENRCEKSRFLLQKLHKLGAISIRGDRYAIRPAGRKLLADLDAARPPFRIFARTPERIS